MLSAGFFQMPKACIQNFFDTPQLGSPEFPHVVKSLIYSGFKRRQPGTHRIAEYHQQYRVGNHRHADGDVELYP
jgi:hypothetical protein